MYQPYYEEVKKRDIKNPQKSTMSKFSLNEQRQIVGSYEKLQEFKNGVDIVELFNRVRPSYPVSKYGGVLYNGEMEILTKKIITKEETNVINDWLSYAECKKIRAYFYGQKVDAKYNKEASLLENMFNKYDSELDKNEHIYRGLRFNKDNEIFDILIQTYKQAYKEKGLIQIDEAPSSFSRDKKVAYDEFARVNDIKYNSLVFHLTKRTKGELYIKEFADKFAYQDEIVIKSHKSLYEIKSIKQNSNFTIIEIEEFEDD